MTDRSRDLDSDPHGQAETARIASGRPGEDATDATEAETPEANLARIRGDADAPPAEAGEAIERATAPLGESEE